MIRIPSRSTLFPTRRSSDLINVHTYRVGRIFEPCQWLTSQTRSRSTSRTGTRASRSRTPNGAGSTRSEEHTSELQSRQYLVCRLLLEKKKDAISSHWVYREE